MIKTLVPALMAITFGSQVVAAPFSADDAMASSEFSSSYVAVNTINGTGLSSNTAIGEAHANYAQGNHWTTARNTDPLQAWITWSFLNVADIGGIYIWNHRSNVIASNSEYEPTLFDLEFFDNSAASLVKYTDVALQPDTPTAQAFSLPAVLSGVKSVTFSVKQTQGSQSYTGLAEVAFDDAVLPNATQLAPTPSPVPLPTGLPVLASALVLTGAVFRRRKG